MQGADIGPPPCTAGWHLRPARQAGSQQPAASYQTILADVLFHVRASEHADVLPARAEIGKKASCMTRRRKDPGVSRDQPGPERLNDRYAYIRRRTGRLRINAYG